MTCGALRPLRASGDWFVSDAAAASGPPPLRASKKSPARTCWQANGGSQRRILLGSDTPMIGEEVINEDMERQRPTSLPWLGADPAVAFARYLPQLKTEYSFWMEGVKELPVDGAHRRVVALDDGLILNRYWDDSDAPTVIPIVKTSHKRSWLRPTARRAT